MMGNYSGLKFNDDLGDGRRAALKLETCIDGYNTDREQVPQAAQATRN